MMRQVIFFPIILAAIITINPLYAADNIHFSGALVAEPCTLPDSDTDIHVDFGTVIVKYLYQYQRTKSQMFTIHLENCDPSILKTVSVTFKGTTDDELTDMLTLDTSSSAKGIAIGLELNDGVLLAVNKSSPATQLVSGKNSLTFGAYVKAKPTMVASKSLSPGDFTANSTFLLSYQ